MKKAIILLYAFVLCFKTVNSQDLNTTNNSNYNYNKSYNSRTIEVVGYSTVNLEPDIIYVSFTIKQDDNLSSTNILKQDEKIKAAVKSIGYDEHNLRVIGVLGYNTMTFSVDTEQYARSRTYSLKFKSIEDIDKFLRVIDMKTLNNFTIESFDRRDLTNDIRKIQIEAFKYGKEKAETLLAVYNKKLGEIIEIQEIQRHIIYPKLSGQQSNTHHIVTSNQGGNYVQMPALNMHDIKLEYQVRLVFEIK